MENSRQLFKELTLAIKINENYIKRDYQSIGGMWTTDTWKKDDLTVQVQDEGYTIVLMNVEDKVNWRIIQNYKNDLIFEGITEEDFISYYSAKLNPPNIDIDSQENKPKRKMSM